MAKRDQVLVAFDRLPLQEPDGIPIRTDRELSMTRTRNVASSILARRSAVLGARIFVRFHHGVTTLSKGPFDHYGETGHQFASSHAIRIIRQRSGIAIVRRGDGRDVAQASMCL